MGDLWPISTLQIPSLDGEVVMNGSGNDRVPAPKYATPRCPKVGRAQCATFPFSI